MAIERFGPPFNGVTVRPGDARQTTFTVTSWITLRRPDIGWSTPVSASAREANTTGPRCLGVQGIEKRRYSRPRGGSMSAGRHVAASSVRT